MDEVANQQELNFLKQVLQHIFEFEPSFVFFVKFSQLSKNSNHAMFHMLNTGRLNRINLNVHHNLPSKIESFPRDT